MRCSWQMPTACQEVRSEKGIEGAEPWQLHLAPVAPLP